MVTATAPRSLELPPFEIRGGLKTLMLSEDRESLLEGPAGTGKTMGICWWADRLATKYPKSRSLFLRKTLKSLSASTLVTFQNKILTQYDPVSFYGGSGAEPASFRYANGSRIVLGGMDNPDKILSTEYDFIYCFVGETLVESQTAIEKAYSREYSGPLVTIRTATGNELTGTPNHPILTDYGWVALGLLNEGDYVISRAVVEEVGVGDPDVQNQPAPIAEVARALTLANGSDTERVMGLDMDFHGDGGNGYVDIVAPRRQLQLIRQSAHIQQFSKSEIGSSDLQLLAVKRQGTPAQVLLGSGLPASGGSSSLSKGLDKGGVSIPSTKRGLAHGERSKATPPEFGLERGVRDTNGRRDGVKPSFSGEVTSDRIVHFSKWNQPDGTSRQVYNLQTQGHSYIANNIIVHNCNEATELSLEDWETLTVRLRNGVMPIPRLVGDCNPTHNKHWLLLRCNEGKTRHIKSRLEDNPAYYDEDGNLTEAGRQYVETLDALTGSRYQRFRLGQWVGVENAIYDNFDRFKHLVPVREDGGATEGAIGVDYGDVHPHAVVAVTRTTGGRLVVRETWAGRSYDDLVSTVGRFRDQYKITRVRVDPMLKGWEKPENSPIRGRVNRADASPGSRKNRIELVYRLFGDNALTLDINGEGNRELADEIEMYHYVHRQTDTLDDLVVARINDDRVAALEYAIEELEGVSYQPASQRGQIRYNAPQQVREYSILR